jgi:ABC-type glycerol-3-phosphate transport system permease component
MLLFIDRFPWRTLVETNDQYELLTDNTFWLSIILAVAALIIAFFLAQTIAYQPDKSDFRKRKRMFYIIGLLSLILFWVYNYFIVSPKIINDAFNIKFSSIASFGYIYRMLLLIAGIYGLGGFVFAKAFKNNKFGSIFP